jgi:hypothetical protein
LHKNPIELPATPAGVQPLKFVRPDGSEALADLPLVYDLQHYIELELLPSYNKTSMTFGAALIYIARSMDGAKTGDRSLSIAVKFSREGHPELGGAVLIGNRQIGDSQAYPVGAPGRMLYESPWFPIIEGSDPDKGGPSVATLVGGVQQGGSQVPTTPVGTTLPVTHSGTTTATARTTTAATKATASTTAHAPPAPAKAAGTANGPLPYTVTTTVIETRPTKEFLAFAASVFTNVEPAVTDAVKGAIDPATQLSAKATAIDTQTAYATAYANAQTALFAYCALKPDIAKADLIAKSLAARTSQLAANKAALTADITAPFPTLVDVSTSDPQAINACTPYR